MWYTILITLVVDFGGLLFVYLLLRDRVRRATSVESRMAEVREEVSRLLVELNQATDRNIALMEDKISILNEAISTADKKIGLLRRETEKHDVGSQIYSRLAEGRHQRAPVPAAREPDVPGEEESEAVQDTRPAQAPAARRAAASQPVPQRAQRTESAGHRTAETNPPSTSAGGFGDAESAGYRDAAEQRDSGPPPLAVQLSGAPALDVRQRVMMLYRAGFSPSLIASRVGAPVGEVELIISLEQRKGQA